MFQLNYAILKRFSKFSNLIIVNGKKFTNFWPKYQRLLLSTNIQNDISTSINMNELNKFRKLSNNWWKGEEFLSLRNMNQLRVPFIVDAFQSFDYMKSFEMDARFPLNNIKLLDIGCGGGILAESLARLGANITGIDPVNENIQVAKYHLKQSMPNAKITPDYQCITIEEFGAQLENQNAFDGIIASEVLEHIEDFDSFLRHSISCIKPGGFFFITTINQTLFSYIGAIFLAEYIFGWLPKGTHEYSKFIPPSSLSLILQDCK